MNDGKIAKPTAAHCMLWKFEQPGTHFIFLQEADGFERGTPFQCSLYLPDKMLCTLASSASISILSNMIAGFEYCSHRQKQRLSGEYPLF
ncbi:hypothetical protein KPSA1B_101014 [Pseudomonas syringae pv. actinidiae]|nr:hypothetical protein ALP75_202525 [Pseudomonas syringae pv. actinidiae]BBI42305.1 hypothetical protein KPSA1B_101014 [Pseudomonas syringae pv. actinidiae]